MKNLDWPKFGRCRLVLRVGAWLAVLSFVSRPACAVPLTDLLAGSSISVGDCWFTDWELVSVAATGASPNLSLVSVSPLANDLGNPGIQFSGNNQLSVAGINSLDLVVKYRVQVLPAGNTFAGHSLTISNLTFGSGGGIGFVSNGLTTGPGVHLDSAVAIGNPGGGVFQLADGVSFASTSGVFVTTNIFLQGLALGDTINLSTFNQRFLQVGPPVLEGDYNENGVVDAADYTVWRNKVGAVAGTLPNDTAGGAIGAAQYNLWKSKFGMVASGAGAIAAAVPEPATGVSLWALAIVWRISRRCRVSRAG